MKGFASGSQPPGTSDSLSLQGYLHAIENLAISGFPAASTVFLILYSETIAIITWRLACMEAGDLQFSSPTCLQIISVAAHPVTPLPTLVRPSPIVPHELTCSSACWSSMGTGRPAQCLECFLCHNRLSGTFVTASNSGMHALLALRHNHACSKCKYELFICTMLLMMSIIMITYHAACNSPDI